MFLDVDCVVAPDFWDRLLAFMDAFGVPHRKKEFFVIPVLYLSPSGSEEFKQQARGSRETAFMLRWLLGDKDCVENFAPCSSLMVLNRLHYLAVGGHNPEFRGHGFEDFELFHRLLSESGRLPRSADYYEDTKTWDTATYRGFRSEFSLLGRPAMHAGLYAFHIWHPRPVEAQFYDRDLMQANRTRGAALLKDFDANGYHPEPLADGHAKQRVLFFGSPRSKSSSTLREIIPLLGTVHYVNENDLCEADGTVLPETIASLIEQFGITLVLFPNPHGNPARMQFYQWCRDTGFPYLAYDRGALPDSWFFDPNGSNADSSSYDRSHWDAPLDEAQTVAVRSYIQRALQGDITLEKQSVRLGPEALRHRLRTGGKRVLFVPLQRPSDTSIKRFAGEAGDTSAFLARIDMAARTLRKHGWTVLCKKHPLETEAQPLTYASYVPPDTNFIDLVELADAVALINSGVGVYAAMAGKPCYVLGDAFYSFVGVNVALTKADDLAQAVLRGAVVDAETVERFIHHLTSRIYSFGRPTVTSRTEADGSLRTVTTAIDFYQIRIPGVVATTVDHPECRPPAPQIPTSAPLFERYRLDLALRKKAAPAKTADHREEGFAAFHQSRFGDAITSFSEALKAEPGNFEMHRNLAEAQVGAGDRNAAAATLRAAIAINPTHKRVRKRLLTVKYPWLSRFLKKTEHTVPKK